MDTFENASMRIAENDANYTGLMRYERSAKISHFKRTDRISQRQALFLGENFRITGNFHKSLK